MVILYQGCRTSHTLPERNRWPGFPMCGGREAEIDLLVGEVVGGAAYLIPAGWLACDAALVLKEAAINARRVEAPARG